jgi:GNAT superfamily N-acetyltransferase
VGQEAGMNAQTPIEPFVRPAIPDDAEGIAKVHVKSWQEAYVGQLPQHVLDRQSVPARMRWWCGVLHQPRDDRWTFVAVDPAAGIVGFVGGERVRRTMFGPAYSVPMLYVVQSHVRRGLGMKLMHALGQAMARDGSGDVEVRSLASNMSARDFYATIGGRLAAASIDRDHNRVPLAGYRWRSAAELAGKSGRRT